MKRTKMERLRLGVVYVLVCCCFAAVAARLVHLQVFKHTEYEARVVRQSSRRVEIPAGRGLIYDRRGQVVANNVVSMSLYAYPESKRELAAVAKYIEGLFGQAPGTAAKRYGLEPHRFRWVKRHLSDKLAARIEATAPEGLYLREETQRAYPSALIGRQILGFTDIDNRGRAGMELANDSLLAGKKGFADLRRDGLRNLYRVKERAMVKPVPGKSLVLTVDWQLQEILENELRRGVDTFHARNGVGVFLDCNTGEILAMAHYDPTEEDAKRPMKVRAVTDQFEPGSVFKVVAASRLMDLDLIDYEDTVYCEEGLWKMEGGRLRDDKKLGWLTFRQIIELSSNIGIGKEAQLLGGEVLRETAMEFGFGERCGTGLGGEIAGQVATPGRWSEYNIAALAMGHAVACNALQMANVLAAIANGGELLRPRLIRCCVDDRGRVTDQCRREVMRKVMERTTSDSLRAMLRGVVERGTAAEKVNSAAVTIAGKTGTAEVPKLNGRGYRKNKFTASFAGFFPYEDPQVAGIIVFAEPEPIHYGGHTAGPVFRRIAERYVVLNPDRFGESGRMLAEQHVDSRSTVEAPHLIGREVSVAKAMAEQAGLELYADVGSGTIAWQYPSADRLMFAGDRIIVAVVSEKGTLPMVDLTGLSVRQASAFLAFAGIKGRIRGRGVVRKQSIHPGEPITDQAVCWLECRPT